MSGNFMRNFLSHERRIMLMFDKSNVIDIDDLSPDSEGAVSD